MKCFIMDDQYGKSIYTELSKMFPKQDFPIKENITNPLEYTDKIKDNDIVLLDNYFPWEWREEPLWAYFLDKLLKKKVNCKIVCISDYWKRLLEQYDEWEQAYNDWLIIWFAPDKSANTVKKYLIES